MIILLVCILSILKDKMTFDNLLLGVFTLLK